MKRYILPVLFGLSACQDQDQSADIETITQSLTNPQYFHSPWGPLIPVVVALGHNTSTGHVEVVYMRSDTNACQSQLAGTAGLAGDTTVYASDQNDYVSSYGGSDTYTFHCSNTGAITLNGSYAANHYSIWLNAGWDDNGNGNDYMWCGANADAWSGVTCSGGNGADSIYVNTTHYNIFGGSGNDAIITYQPPTFQSGVSANDGDDCLNLYHHVAPFFVSCGTGNDRVVGGPSFAPDCEQTAFSCP